MKTNTGTTVDRTIRMNPSFAVSATIMTAIAAMLISPADAQVPVDPSVIFSEDFSGSNPLADFNLENPPGPQSPMAIGIDNEALVMDYLYGFGVASADLKTAINFKDTFLDGDLTLETAYPYDPRGMGNIGWVNGTSSQGYIHLGLQLDENRAYLFAGLGGSSGWTSSAIQVDRNVAYRLRLEVRSPDIIRGYVNNQLVVSLNFNLGIFPVQMNPAVFANSYPSLRIRHDNLVVRTINQPPFCDAGTNLQIASSDQTSTVIPGTAGDPDQDALQYRWLEGTTILRDWASVGSAGEAALVLSGLPVFTPGNHTLTLEVKDALFTVSDGMVLTVENSPPEVRPAPSYQVVEIGVDPIVVIADAADFDGDTLTYEWYEGMTLLDFGTVAPPPGGDRVAIPDLMLPAGHAAFDVGLHQVELRVGDGVNPAVSAFVSVEVTDTTRPSLSPLPSVTILWPPNHKLQPVVIGTNAADNGGGAIHLAVQVTSSEAPDAAGDGQTIPDYYIDSVNDATGVIELRLRSERSGKGPGRTYTVVITAEDPSGNQSVASVVISAPHDKRKP